MNSDGKKQVVSRFGALIRVLAATLTIIVCASGPSRAQSGSAIPPNPATHPALTSGAVKPPRASREGIAVHGHWTIEVRNPDGTLAKHIEFENGLCPKTTYPSVAPLGGATVGGGILLTNMLLGYPAGGWDIQLASQTPPPATNAPMPCYDPTSIFVLMPNEIFHLEQNNDGLALSGLCSGTTGALPGAVYCFAALTPPTTNLSNPSITLVATFTVPAAVASTTITAVGTGITFCGNNANYPTSSVCTAKSPASGIYQLTGANLTGVAPMPGPLTVVASQTVSVTVQLSFS